MAQADLHAFLKSAFRMTRALARDLNAAGREADALLATVTRLDGAFGCRRTFLSSPDQGALAGLVKTAALEWPRVTCRALDVDPAWQDVRQVAEAVVEELLQGGTAEPLEIGLGPQGRTVPVLETVPIDTERPRFGPRDVLVVSGGARGVTAAALQTLISESGPAVAILGRSPEPQPAPEWLAGFKEEAAVKQAILTHEFGGNAHPRDLQAAYRRFQASIEVAQTLESLARKGAQVRYISVDVRRKADVHAALGEIRRSLGPVTALIHGAGVLADRRIVDKTDEQFDRVFDTKVLGLQNLLSALKDDPLSGLVLFSSVAARFGNVGQVDYAMANEALNKIAWQEASRRPQCRVAAINWGPWNGGMVTAALKREFARRRTPLLAVDEGADRLAQEMALAPGSPVEVVIAAGEATLDAHEDPPAGSRPGAFESESGPQDPALELSVAVKRNIDVRRYPVLSSHVLGGNPVVPLALMTEWMGHGALHENPGLVLHGMDEIRILQGIKLDRGARTIRLMAGKARRSGSLYEVDVEIRDGKRPDGSDVIHTRARAILAEKMEAEPSFDPAILDALDPYPLDVGTAYRRRLFHGADLHGIRRVIGISPRCIAAELAAAPPPSRWSSEPLRSDWLADPLVLDSAFQMAILWSFEQRQMGCLPSFAASYRQYRRRFPAEGVTAVLEINSATDRSMRGDFTFLDADSTVVARLTGYEAVLDPSLEAVFAGKEDTRSSRSSNT